MTYRFTVGAKVGSVKRAGIEGTIAVFNPSDSREELWYFPRTGTSFTVTGPNASGIRCRVPSNLPDSGILKPGEEGATPFTCTSDSGLYPDDGVTVEPYVRMEVGPQPKVVPAAGFSPVPPAESEHQFVALSDLLTGDAVTQDGSASDTTDGRADLNDVEISRIFHTDGVPTKATIGSLSELVLDGSELVGANGELGTTDLEMSLGTRAPHYVEGRLQTVTNTVTMCAVTPPEENAATDETDIPEEGDTSATCVPVPKIPADGDQPDATVAPSQAVVTVHDGTATVPIWILKTGVSQDGTASEVPLAGSTFAIFEDDGGNLGAKVADAPLPAPDGVDWPEQAQFLFSGAQRGSTYWLVETRAPAGHQLLAQPVQLKVSAQGIVTLGEGASEFVRVSNKSGDGTQTVVTVSDVEGAHLPAFGGPGVWAVTVAGAALIVAVWLVQRRRAQAAVVVAGRSPVAGRHAGGRQTGSVPRTRDQS